MVIGEEIPRTRCSERPAEYLNKKELGSTILNCNVRGFRSNVDRINEFLEGLHNPKKIKLIGLSESYDCGHKNNYVDTHVLVSKSRPSNKHRGGVAFLVENSLHFTTPSLPNEFVDGVFESLTIAIKDIKILATIIYRPTGCVNSDPAEFNKLLKDFLAQRDKLPESKSYTSIIMGDFNFNIRNTENTHTADYINEMIARLHLPTNCEVNSRVTNTSATLIDQLWINSQDKVQSSFVLNDVYISDHLVNGISLNEHHKSGTTTILSRKITAEKEQAFIDKLASMDWTHTLNEINCDTKWERFMHGIKTALDETCPEKEVKVRTDAGPNRTPWMTQGLRTSEKTLKTLMANATKFPNRRVNNNAKTNLELFREFRKAHDKLRRQVKRDYYNNKFKEVKHDTRATWNMLNKFTCSKRSNTKINDLKVDNKVITDNEEMAKAFNAFYANVGNLQAATIPATNTDPMSFLTQNNEYSMFLRPTCSEEISKACKSLAKKKSKGPDKIPTFLALKSHEVLMVPLADCINSCLTQGIFPANMKQAEVIPLYKKKSRDDPTNYRPVSLLNSYGKIIEKIIYFRLYDFMSKTMFKNQFGFRSGHSTMDLMILTIEETLTQLDLKGNAIPLYFDLGKAFDTLDQNILLAKLECYGIRGVPLQLIRSYLTNRSQYVTVNGVRSDALPVTIGVPQGSILGPLLFIIYINDIPKADESVMIACYADDTSAVVGSHSHTANIRLAKDTLEKLGNWFSSNKLSLSPTKCKFALMSKNLKTATWKANLNIYGKNLTEIRENTDSDDNPLVGLMVNEKMSYKRHVDVVAGKLRSGMYALKSNKQLPYEARKNIYFACVHSHLNYAGLILGTAPQSCTNHLASIQDKAIRILSNARYNANVDPLYKKNHILKLQDIFDVQAATYGWKFINGKLPQAIADRLSKGSIRTLHIQCRKYESLTLKKLSPIDYITNTWNKIPLTIKKNPTMLGFKKALIKQLINDYT